MKFIIIVTTVLFSICLLYSQENKFEKPDYTAIKNAIEDENSSLFYPDLLKRLIDLDTTLNHNEYRHLYLGYSFQKEYQPYWRSPYETEMKNLFQKRNLDNNDFLELKRLAILSIKDNPFDLRNINMLLNMYMDSHDSINGLPLIIRFNGLINAILSTGDGKSCSTGYHVISTSHEYIILELMDFKFKSQALTQDMCDAMSIEKNDSGLNVIYFDVKRIFMAKREKIKSKEN